MATWAPVVANTPRAELVRGGTAVPWILASEILVHTSCTTGVEAFALGKPAISFRPIYVPVIDNYLSPQINFVADKVDELIALARLIVANVRHPFPYPDEFHTEYQRSFANASGPFAAERIMRHLAERSERELSQAIPCAKWQPRPGYVGYISTKAHKKRLMPPIAREEVLERLRRIDLRVGRQDQLRVENCGDRMFHIHGCREIAYSANQTDRGPWIHGWLARIASAVRGVSRSELQRSASGTSHLGSTSTVK
jgi:hypothetical protein